MMLKVHRSLAVFEKSSTQNFGPFVKSISMLLTKFVSKMEFPADSLMFEATVSEYILLEENYKNAELGNVSQWNISTPPNINQLHKTYKENIPAPPCHYVTYPLIITSYFPQPRVILSKTDWKSPPSKMPSKKKRISIMTPRGNYLKEYLSHVITKKIPGMV